MGFFEERRLKLPKRLRLLVCGDRDWEDDEFIRMILTNNWKRIKVIIQGECRGADLFAKQWGEDILGKKYVFGFRAKWLVYGKAAGPIRNQQMIDEGKPDFVLAFHDNFAASKGTVDMIKKAKKAHIPFAIVSHKDPDFKLP